MSLSRSLRNLTMVFCFAALFSLGQGVARADEVFISGFTHGCLCVNPAVIPQPFRSGEFSFAPTIFSGLTSGGSLLLRAGTLEIGPGIGADELSQLNGQQFGLLVTFTTPLGIQGSPVPFSSLFMGTLITNPDDGTLLVDLDVQSRTFSFSSPLGTGQFDLSVFVEVDMLTGALHLMARVSDAFLSPNPVPTPGPVPEPATLILLATGLAGAVGAARRRRGRSSSV